MRKLSCIEINQVAGGNICNVVKLPYTREEIANTAMAYSIPGGTLMGAFFGGLLSAIYFEEKYGLNMFVGGLGGAVVAAVVTPIAASYLIKGASNLMFQLYDATCIA